MLLGNSENLLLNGKRTNQQLLAINLPAAELVPESKEPGMLSQSVPAESFHGAALGQIQDAQEIAFQMSPAKLRFAGVILQIGAKTIAAQHSAEYSSQKAH
jgi:hypothetical protein